MKKAFFISLALLFSSIIYAQDSDTDTLVHKAVYHGNDLMVKNYMDSRHGYSVKEVILDDKVLRDPTNSGTFTIKLTSKGLSEGDEYTLKIVYYSSSQAPKILNEN